MTLFPVQSAPQVVQQRLTALQRKPVRISITISHALHQALLRISDEQGRSLSNLAAYLLEVGNSESPATQKQAAYPYR